MAVMPHGSKMQTLAVSLFAAVHEVSMVFAMPKSYNPHTYSEGLLNVYALELGNTESLILRLRKARVVGYAGDSLHKEAAAI
jgi:hypothetical protein